MVTQQEAQSCSLSSPHFHKTIFLCIKQENIFLKLSPSQIWPTCTTLLYTDDKDSNNWWIIIITHFDICCILSLCVLVGFFVFFVLVFYFLFFQFHRQGMLSKEKLFCFN